LNQRPGESYEIAECVVDAYLLFLKCGMNFELFENDGDNIGLYRIKEWAVTKKKKKNCPHPFF